MGVLAIDKGIRCPGGNFRGTRSQLDIYPDSGDVVVVLSNDASGGS